MAWLQLIFHTPNAVADPLANILSELGAAAVTMADAADQPLYEPSPDTMPLWQNTNVIGLFAMGSDLEAVRAATAKALAPVSLPAWRLEVLEDQKWERLWLENFRPMRFGEQVWIVPSGYSPPAPQAINVLLDPGLAFGTGTQPTTRLCLEWLDRSYLRDATVIDYGCGSGVLAITAALLGAKRVWAIDHDTQAILATNDNAQRNGVADKIHACPTRYATANTGRYADCQHPGPAIDTACGPFSPICLKVAA